MRLEEKSVLEQLSLTFEAGLTSPDKSVVFHKVGIAPFLNGSAPKILFVSGSIL
jgi:hypothetical protein